MTAAKTTFEELLEALERRLIALGYDLDDLDRDNPYGGDE